MDPYSFLEDIVFYSIEKSKCFILLKEKKSTAFNSLKHKFDNSSSTDEYPIEYMRGYYAKAIHEYLADKIDFETAVNRLDYCADATYQEFWLEFAKYVWPGYLR